MFYVVLYAKAVDFCVAKTEWKIYWEKQSFHELWCVSETKYIMHCQCIGTLLILLGSTFGSTRRLAAQHKQRGKKTWNNNIKLHDNFSLYKSDYIAKSSGNASQSARVCEKLFDSKKLITILEENEPSHFAAHLEIKWRNKEEEQKQEWECELRGRVIESVCTNLLLNAA